MPVTRFEELKVWQRAREFYREVHQLTRRKEFSRDYAMSDQLRRAALSVMNNIAEGFERFRRNEFMQYLSTSKASAGEVRSMIYAAFDVGYIDERTQTAMVAQAEEVGKMITSFRTGLERSTPRSSLRTKDQGLRTKDSGLRTSS